MAIVEIPLQSDLDNYFFQIDLDGATYEFELSWNLRNEQWMLTIRDNERNDLISSLPLDVDQLLLDRFKNPLLPKGKLFLLDKRDGSIRPGRNDLGTNIAMYYQEVTT